MNFVCVIISLALLSTTKAAPKNKVIIKVLQLNDKNESNDDDEDDRDEQYNAEDDYYDERLIELGELDAEDLENLSNVINSGGDSRIYNDVIELPQGENQLNLVQLLEQLDAKTKPKRGSRLDLADFLNSKGQNVANKVPAPVPLLSFVSQPNQDKGSFKSVKKVRYARPSEANVDKVSQGQLDLAELLSLIGGNREEQEPKARDKLSVNKGKERWSRVPKSKLSQKSDASIIKKYLSNSEKTKQSPYLSNRVQEKNNKQENKGIAEFLNKLLNQKKSSLSSSLLDEAGDDQTNIYILKPNEDEGAVEALFKPKPNKKFQIQTLGSFAGKKIKQRR